MKVFGGCGDFRTPGSTAETRWTQSGGAAAKSSSSSNSAFDYEDEDDDEDEKFRRSLRTIWTIAVQRLSAVGLSLRPSRLCDWQTLVLWLRLGCAVCICGFPAAYSRLRHNFGCPVRNRFFKMTPACSQPSVRPGARSIIYPLDEFYARSGLVLPPLDQIDGEAMPEPYKSLLVHDRDMTSTLEHFHGAGVHLQLLTRDRRGSVYFRQVLLVLDSNEKPVEFGAIEIHLNRFPEAARERIVAERFPLGHILKEFEIEYSSCPKAFLRIASDELINRVLGLRGAHVLYGRRNTLLNMANESLAEIVEILPPFDRAPGSGGRPQRLVQ